MRFEVLTISAQVTQKLHTPFNAPTTRINIGVVSWVTMEWE